MDTLTCLKAYLQTISNSKQFATNTINSKMSRLVALEDYLNYHPHPLSRLNLAWITRFYRVLRGKGLKPATITKTIQETKNWLRYCLEEELMNDTTAFVFKLPSTKSKPIYYLNENQLKELAGLQLNGYLQEAIDCFIVQCYTGLSYIDLATIDWVKQITTIDGFKVIVSNRVKTLETFRVPLLPKVEAILLKYDYLLPVPCNHLYNKRIKEATESLNLPFHVTSHVGRKTAATYFLSNNVSIKAVAMALGHSDTKTTEKYYATLESNKMLSQFSCFMD